MLWLDNEIAKNIMGQAYLLTITNEIAFHSYNLQLFLILFTHYVMYLTSVCGFCFLFLSDYRPILSHLSSIELEA
mgnify:FL=1